MSSDTCKLSDIADVQGGFAFKSADFSDTGVAVVKIANIQPPSVSLANVDRIAPDKLKGLERFELLDGDILMAMTGATVGKAGRFRLTEPAYLNQRVARISAKKGHLFDDFLYAVVSLPGFDNLIEGASAGSAQANISAAGIGSVVIPKLSDSEQIQIGCIARMLDDRMALLRETNATLEAIAQALFKSWFVDFDPVHARARGEQPAGLAPEVAALFPDRFEESELGMVPKGWSTGSLNDLALLNPESWTVKNRPDSVAYVDLANAKENVIAEITEFLFEDAPSRARRVLRDGDTIVGTVRPGNRSYALISNPRPNLTGSTGFAVLRPKQKAATEYVYLAATANSSIEYLAHVADGGAYPAVRPEVVSNLPCVVPSYDVLNAFHAVAAPVVVN